MTIQNQNLENNVDRREALKNFKNNPIPEKYRQYEFFISKYKFYFYVIDYLYKYQVFHTDFMKIVYNYKTSPVYKKLAPILFPPDPTYSNNKSHISFQNVQKDAALFALSGAASYVMDIRNLLEYAWSKNISFDISSSHKLNISNLKKLFSILSSIASNNVPQSELLLHDAIEITETKLKNAFLYKINTFSHILPYLIPELYYRMVRLMSLLQISNNPQSLLILTNTLKSLSPNYNKLTLSIIRNDKPVTHNPLKKIINFYQKNAAKQLNQYTAYNITYLDSNPHKMYFKVSTTTNDLLFIYADSPYAFYELYRTFKFSKMSIECLNNLIPINKDTYLFTIK